MHAGLAIINGVIVGKVHLLNACQGQHLRVGGIPAKGVLLAVIMPLVGGLKDALQVEECHIILGEHLGQPGKRVFEASLFDARIEGIRVVLPFLARAQHAVPAEG